MAEVSMHHSLSASGPPARIFLCSVFDQSYLFSRFQISLMYPLSLERLCSAHPFFFLFVFFIPGYRSLAILLLLIQCLRFIYHIINTFHNSFEALLQHRYTKRIPCAP